MDAGIGSWLAIRAAQNGTKIALVDGPSGARTTYAELQQRSVELAGSLFRAGVRQGDRVALLSTNRPAFMEVVFGVAKLGAILVPLNYRLSPAELAYMLADSGAGTLFVSPDLADLAAKALQHDDVRVSRTIELGSASTAHEPLPDFVTEGEFCGADVAERDVCMIMYTSGTTGRPKGAMLTHGNMLWNAINILSAEGGLLHSDITLSVAPLFHIGGMGAFMLPSLYLGCTVVIIGQFDPVQALEIMERERVSVTFMVPAMWSAIMHTRQIESFDSSNIRYVHSGGAPCPIPILRFFRERGWPFFEAFGMTETSPTCTVLGAGHTISHAGSIGRPLQHVECRIVDDTDQEVADETAGELLIRGRNVFIGYWGMPRESAAALRGGWFHTGDLAKRDGDGFITLVDRKKDMIISGGENVYPIEVERVLTEHPHVADVAVIGVPSEQWGETVMAVIVAKENSAPDPDELIEFCRCHLARYKAPRQVKLVSELPRNATGKLLKRVLRECYAGTEVQLYR